jgi:hypothetical protein
MTLAPALPAPAAPPAGTPIPAGADLRDPRLRREVFHRFYTFQLRWQGHPGAVYYLLPWLAARHGWDPEATLWFAFLNGATQHPVTTWLLHRAGPLPEHAAAVLNFWQANYQRLAFDTDRRYHKRALPDAIAGYLALLDGQPQADYWTRTAQAGWPAMWQATRAIPTFGRLSAFSYAEYLWLLGYGTDAGSLMLDDLPGSRSHRNGLCKVLGRDELDWHASNPGFDGRYPPPLLTELTAAAEALLTEARTRNTGEPWAGHVSRFTLESALCTYKSWHRRGRRYPNVYNDMLHERLLATQTAWPDADLDTFWAAREATLAPRLRLEATPADPGLRPVKQNHYLDTGHTVMLGHDWPELTSEFDRAVSSAAWGTFR